jgi:hypothetical protein
MEDGVFPAHEPQQLLVVGSNGCWQHLLFGLNYMTLFTIYLSSLSYNGTFYCLDRQNGPTNVALPVIGAGDSVIAAPFSRYAAGFPR